MRAQAEKERADMEKQKEAERKKQEQQRLEDEKKYAPRLSPPWTSLRITHHL